MLLLVTQVQNGDEMLTAYSYGPQSDSLLVHFHQNN
jgi:hypothetical protein